MRSIAMLGVIAAFATAPLAAQGRTFRTGDVVDQAGRVPSTVMGQVIGDEQEGRSRSPRKSDHIPPGQMPPAGMCRIWIDGVPPGQQPAPTDCQTAVARKPANARVIFGGDGTQQLKANGKASKHGKNKVKKEKHDDRDDDRDDEGDQR